MTRYSYITALAVTLASGTAIAATYDIPVKTEKVKLAADPLNPQAKAELSCFSYDGFGVKQVDRGDVGAERLSITPLAPGKTLSCREALQPGERVIPQESWSGYFEGAKGSYVFFTAPDGTNGGMGFAVFRADNATKLFEDNAQQSLQSLEPSAGGLTLKYQRVFAGKCSAITDGSECRDAIAKESGVAGRKFSLCEDGYEAAQQNMAKLRCAAQSESGEECIREERKAIADQKWKEAPTVIAFDARAVIGSGAPQVTPLGDVIACRPSD